MHIKGLFSSLPQGQQDQGLISESRQRLSDPGGWAEWEQTLLTTADLFLPAILGEGGRSSWDSYQHSSSLVCFLVLPWGAIFFAKLQ